MAFTTPRGLALTLLLLAPTFSVADDISDQIATAKEVYESGKLRQAVQELHYAAAQIQEQMNQANTLLMPDPLTGWNATDAQSQSGGLAAMAGGTTISRDYSSDRGENVTIQIIADSPLLQAMSMMLSNPMMMQMSPGTRMYRYQGYNGAIKHQSGSSDWEISLLIQNRILVQVTGTGLDSKQAVEDYLKAIDLKAVEAAFTN